MNYKYLATDAQGQEISGVINAANEREAARQLRQRELRVLEVGPAAVSSTGAGGGKARPRDVLLALHELATLLEADISLIDAVESLAESSHHPALTQAFAQMGAELRHGSAFSVTLQRGGLKLPDYFPHLLEAGELTGKLAQALRQGVAQMEYQSRVHEEMRNAMIYPSILVFSGVAAVLLIFTLVVPRFASVLKTRGDDLPWLAQAVLGTGVFVNSHWHWIVGALAVLGGLAWNTLGQAERRARLLDTLAGLPSLGEWIVEAETGRWAAMLGTLLENRVPLLRALELALLGVQLPSLRARLGQVSKAVRAGSGLAQALQDNHALSVTGHNLIRAGERAGQLPKMLNSLARLFEDSGRTRMKRFLLLLEPVAILLIGGVIGVIITGVMLTITSVNQINF